jgi:hypothetical protein
VTATLLIAVQQTEQQFVSRRNPSRPVGRPRGRPFAKGRSGNPGGRLAGPPKTAEQKKYDADVRALAREHGPDAIQKLSEIMGDANAPHAARVSAANSLLDRGYGRPSQSVEVSAPNSDSLPDASEEEALEFIRSRLEEIRQRMGANPEQLKSAEHLSLAEQLALATHPSLLDVR